MLPIFNCIATGIGSLPHVDPAQAVALVLQCLPEAPIWPQLPRRSFLEHFCVQYSEGLPGISLDKEKERLFFDTSRDPASGLERFYERYLARNLEHFRISEEYAAGFHAFTTLLKKSGLPGRARFLK